MPGSLIVCPTPIGNLDDITLRVRDALVAADYIACEDTRRTGALLDKLGIRPAPPLVSNHEGNEASRATELAQRIERGDTVVLVSDAGMPAISDPGFRLVRRCIERSLEVDRPARPLGGAGGAGRLRPADRPLALRGVPAEAPGGDGARAALGRDRCRLRVAAPGRRVAGGAGGDRPRPPGRGLPRDDEDARGGRARLAGRAGPALPRRRQRRDRPRDRPRLLRGPRDRDVGFAVDALRHLVQSGARPRAAASVVAALTGTRANDLYRALTGREPRQ